MAGTASPRRNRRVVGAVLRHRSWPVVIAALLCLAAASNAAAATGFPFTPVPGSPFATDDAPLSAAFSPSGSLLATANYFGADVSVFTVNAQTDALTPAPASPYTAGSGPDWVTFSPSGTLLAATNLVDGTVSVFAVDASSGALTEVPGSPFATGNEPRCVGFSPGGGLLAVANAADDTVSVFSVNGSTGALTQVPGSPFATGSDPLALAFSPSGGLLAVANADDDTVSVLSVDGSTGALTQVSGSPFTTGNGPYAVAFNPSGSLLAVANAADDTVSAFSVNGSTGALTQVPGSPSTTGPDPLAVAFSADGSLLATANDGGGDVSVFAVDPTTGVLTEASESPLSAGNEPHSVAFAPAGDLLAVTNRSDNTVDMLEAALPTATLSWPPSGGTYTQGEQVATNYVCAENPSGPGLASCDDSSGGSSGEGSLNTSRAGTYSYQVTAVSQDGRTSTASITYTVVAVPAETAAPVISGEPTLGARLRCSQGSWTGLPSAYGYQWSRNGVPLQGADQATYAVLEIDEGSTLTCAVTAANSAGPGVATLVGSVVVPVPNVRGCPPASGRLSGTALGVIALGDSRPRVRSALRSISLSRHPYEDMFCFTPAGLAVGYPTPALLHALPRTAADQLQGRVVWAATSNPIYSADGITSGSTLAAAEATLRHGSLLNVDGRSVYLAPLGGATVVLSARGGIVTEIGIANRQLTKIPTARLALIQSLL
jgi:6-phosphogluconolactonase (cycloisomerase 2 family)